MYICVYLRIFGDNMSYEQIFTSISIRIPKSLRVLYMKARDFWKELGAFFSAVVLLIEEKELDELRVRFPNIIMFVEDVLP